MILGWLLRYLSPLLGVVIAVLLSVSGWLYVTKQSLELDFAKYKSASVEALAKANYEANEKEREAREANDNVSNDYQKREESLRSELDAALARVRNHKNNTPRLQPASNTPAECRNYEAPPSRLSQADREFLVRIGAEADQVAAQLAAAQEYIDKVVHPNGRVKD
jgi:hypothetical protein